MIILQLSDQITKGRLTLLIARYPVQIAQGAVQIMMTELLLKLMDGHALFQLVRGIGVT